MIMTYETEEIGCYGVQVGRNGECVHLNRSLTHVAAVALQLTSMIYVYEW